MKTKLNKNARPPSAAPRYTCCVAEYYVPGLDKSEIVRVTGAVVDHRPVALHRASELKPPRTPWKF